MEDKDKTIKFLSNLLYDIQCDNEVVFCGEWSKKDIELSKSIEVVLDYLESRRKEDKEYVKM